MTIARRLAALLLLALACAALTPTNSAATSAERGLARADQLISDSELALAELEGELSLDAEADADADAELDQAPTVPTPVAPTSGEGCSSFAEVDAEAEAEADAEVDSASLLESEVDAELDAELDAEAEAEVEAEAEADAEAEAEAEVAASNGLCGDYASAYITTRVNNAGQKVNVVAIKKEHLTDASIYGKSETQADNTMLTTTACAYSKLRSAASQAGHSITINSGFRTLARQQYFWNCYQCKRQGKKNCCNNGNLAASPGKSNHGTGIALDLQLTTAAYNWMRTNAEKHGFVRTVATEKWHWENRPASKQSAFFKI